MMPQQQHGLQGHKMTEDEVPVVYKLIFYLEVFYHMHNRFSFG